MKLLTSDCYFFSPVSPIKADSSTAAVGGLNGTSMANCQQNQNQWNTHKLTPHPHFSSSFVCPLLYPIFRYYVCRSYSRVVMSDNYVYYSTTHGLKKLPWNTISLRERCLQLCSYPCPFPSQLKITISGQNPFKKQNSIFF